ncbi:DUF883 family protein [Chelativorans alearense]|uniref:DUF883 family protein n=1 Tax=Chelativorans alearense TaxID=2681495 RepID=UPI0013CF50B5|nr:DUF883 family protein [Chelativorans alearense]
MAATTSRTGGKEATRDLEEDIRQLREDVARLTQHMRQASGHSASVARHAASEGMEQMRQQGKTAIRSLKSGANDFEHELAETLRERPVTSLAIAVGVGYLLALMSRR